MVNLHYLFGKYEVNLRKFERIVYIYLRMAESSGEVKWQLGREQQSSCTGLVFTIHASQQVSDKLVVNYSKYCLVNLQFTVKT
jgi:hypothetical protein